LHQISQIGNRSLRLHKRGRFVFVTSELRKICKTT